MKPLSYFLVTFVFGASPSGALGQVPQLIHFQGQLTQHNQNFNGVGEFKLALVNGTGDVTLWSNDGTGQGGNEPSNAVPVLVHKGFFSVTLGDAALPHMTPVSPLVFTNEDVRLRLWFSDAKPEKKPGKGDRDDDPAGRTSKPKPRDDFELLAPDQRVTSVGYAMFSANVADGAITASKLAPNAVGSMALAPGSVGTRQLASGAVTREKIAPGAIPPTVIGDGSVATRHLAEGAVKAGKLADGAVTGPKLLAGAVDTAQLADGSVTQPKLGSASVGPGQLAPGTVSSNHLAAGAALANLKASGQSGVASGGIILSFEENSAALASAGYVRAGSLPVTREKWQNWTGFGSGIEFAVWTGTELIAGCGRCGSGGRSQVSRYDPVSDRWQSLSVAPNSVSAVPLFVWTGSELILWGGHFSVRSGIIYNRATDRWRPMTLNGAPDGRENASVVWTGTEMLIWGGDNRDAAFNTGARYDPVQDRWQPISTNRSPRARTWHTAVWTGEEMIVWGGHARSNGLNVYLNTGGRYRPSTDSWTPLLWPMRLLPLRNIQPFGRAMI